MSHKDRSLFMFGREGRSTHELFLISKGFDLSHFEEVEISFDYLIMDIGDDDSNPHKTTEEYLKAEVCLFGEYECGLNPVDPAKLRSSKWITIFTNDPHTSQNGLNGRNHDKHDWESAHARVNLGDLENRYPDCHRENFVFRFNSRLQDGFRSNNFTKEIEDAVAVDNVVIKATSGH